MITLDYVSGSIGVDLGLVVEGLSKIEINTIGRIDHRLKGEALDLDIWISSDQSHGYLYDL